MCSRMRMPPCLQHIHAQYMWSCKFSRVLLWTGIKTDRAKTLVWTEIVFKLKHSRMDVASQIWLIPASLLRDLSSAVQTSVALLFGRCWSRISHLQTDLWEQPPQGWAAGTSPGLALADPRPDSCTSPDGTPGDDRTCRYPHDNTVW